MTNDILRIDPRTDARWQELVHRCSSSVFHSPTWMQVLGDTYGFDVQAYVKVDAEGRPTAGLPFVHVDDMLGPRIVSVPFSDYCDPLVQDRDVWNELSTRLIEGQIPATIRCLHNAIPTDDPLFRLTKRARWHGMDLTADIDTIWSRLQSSARWGAKKAQRNGVVVRIADSEEELRSFFAMHLGVRKRKYHMLAQPYRFFEQLWRRFVVPGNGALLLATYEREIIGCVLFLRWKDTLYYKFNASNAAYLSLEPNDLMLWEGIRYAKEQGCRHLDFGLSDWDQEGLVRFKRKFATEEKAISFLRHTPERAADPRAADIASLLSQLTSILTVEDVPEHVSARAGDLLYRYFV